jgi:hypothetical protein
MNAYLDMKRFDEFSYSTQKFIKVPSVMEEAQSPPVKPLDEPLQLFAEGTKVLKDRRRYHLNE